MKLTIFFVVVVLAVISHADDYHEKFRKRQPKNSETIVVNVQEGSRTFWRNKAQNQLSDILTRKASENKAKNVILFLGDGMGLSTVSAARAFTGGEQNFLSFEKFPHFGLSKTYCLDRQVADSACTATAYATGVKGNYNTIGVNGNVVTRNCTINDEDKVYSITKWAQDSGKSSGIVTTTRVTHASPAGFYAHVPTRSLETDTDITSRCGAGNANFNDIAYQLVHNEEGKKLKVILGGGRQKFRNTTAIDEEGRAGHRNDGRDLIKEWIDDRSQKGKTDFVWHKRDLLNVDYSNTEYLLGLFEHDHCLYQQVIKDDNLEHQEPSLSEMTAAAIKMLQKDDEGFFLLVEGGRIDHAHHSNYVSRNVQETREFSRAIDVARHMTEDSDTLIVVTADHSHVFTQNGYPDRYENILGAPETGSDRLPYASLSYGNGPGYPTTYENSGDSFTRVDLSTVDMRNPTRRSSATVPLSSETHGGEDVGVYASGPWSRLFTGNYEQNYIPVLMAYAAGIGPFEVSNAEETTSPPPTTTVTDTTTTDGASNLTLNFSIIVTIFATFLIKIIFNNHN